MRQLAFKRHRFPADIVRHSVWPYARFTLSYRDVEEMLAEPGLDASHETVRRRFPTCGSATSADNRTENWHRPVRRRERTLYRRFKPVFPLQRRGRPYMTIPARMQSTYPL